MVTGSLLGLAVENGILEVTHSFPFPDPRFDRRAAAAAAADAEDDAAGLEGHEFQMEMMRMLREVNVDNNCVGWYQSMYLGIYSTSSLLDNQLSYQTDLSPNAVVVLYDPMQSSNGNIVLKCLRLTDECIRIRSNGENVYIDPKNIFEEVPVTLRNPGLARVLLADIQDGLHDTPSHSKDGSTLFDARADTSFDRLDLSMNPYLEKHLEFLCGWVDDLSTEQHKFQYFSRQLARKGKDKSIKRSKEDWAGSDAPRRMESLLISNQIRSYCEQMDRFTGDSIDKLYLMDGLHLGNTSAKK
jgi:translation initiation factor 3 subunit H